MRPAFSVIIFTTLAGAAQGLVVTLAIATLLGAAIPSGFTSVALAVTVGMLVASLGASFLHLGRPERAWRAILMWRTSWLSREVIVMPVFIVWVALWWLAVWRGVDSAALPIVAIAIAALLWYCTAMIYACLRFIQEWAHPLTIANYTLLGLASGLVLAVSLAAVSGANDFAYAVVPWALLCTLAAWATRTASLIRNASLRPKSTLQSATGIRNEKLVQTSMGMSAGAFNTREFFHGATRAAIRRTRLGFIVLTFVAPCALLLIGWIGGAGSGTSWALAAVFPVQYAGLLAERWFFFAQAQHPQNLYYQVVS